jgi:hypothetical protein
MSGVGKTTILDELRRRGHLTVDTDYDGWVLPDGAWDERRMDELLARQPDVIVSGTVENQGRFYNRFQHVVLVSAPLDVLIVRVRHARRVEAGRAACDILAASFMGSGLPHQHWPRCDRVEARSEEAARE